MFVRQMFGQNLEALWGRQTPKDKTFELLNIEIRTKFGVRWG